MLFGGEKPKASEHGPYIYKEVSGYSKPENWNQRTKSPGLQTSYYALSMDYTRNLFYAEDNKNQGKDMDTPIWQLN